MPNNVLYIEYKKKRQTKEKEADREEEEKGTRYNVENRQRLLS